jgi:hypothetical protein
MENSMAASQKLKIKLFHDPTNALLGMYAKEYKSGFNKGIGTLMFIAALFTIESYACNPDALQLINELRKYSIYVQCNFIWS